MGPSQANLGCQKALPRSAPTPSTCVSSFCSARETLRFGLQGGFRVSGFGFRVSGELAHDSRLLFGPGFFVVLTAHTRSYSPTNLRPGSTSDGFRVQGLGFRVQGLGFSYRR